MADVFSKKKRSRIMSKIRSSGTKPEKVCRALVRAVTGRAIRLNVRSLPGSPDVVVPSLRLAVFMDGCFWHACPLHGCRPKSNVDFWEKKLRRNVSRDRRTRRDLRSMGWVVWTVWEHDLRLKAIPATRRRLRRRFRCMVAARGGPDPRSNTASASGPGGPTGPQGRHVTEKKMATTVSKPKKSTKKVTKATKKAPARTAKKPATKASAKKPARKAAARTARPARA